MSSILKLPISAVSFIFSQVSNLDSKVSWIRTPDYTQQLYVSPSYQTIWGINPDKLYEHPLSWNETVINSSVINKLKNRMPENNPTVHYQILGANNKIQFLKDTCFHLFDPHGELIAVAGVSEVISEACWDDELKNTNSKSNANDPITNILTHAMHHFPALVKSESTQKRNAKIILTQSGEAVKLTQREADCLNGLTIGQSAKQIGRTLSISPRTVEVHIENMKLKLGCRTRIELISKLNSLV